MNIYTFLSTLRDKVPGDNPVVSVFLMGDEIRVRIDTNLGQNHCVYVVTKPAKEFLILNDETAGFYYKAFGEELNAKLAEWEVGES